MEKTINDKIEKLLRDHAAQTGELITKVEVSYSAFRSTDGKLHPIPTVRLWKRDAEKVLA